MNTEKEIEREAASVLSMYMDGELSVHDRDHLLQSLKSDGAARDNWLVYHCIGDALRSDDAVPLTGGFGSRFKARLADEPFLLVPEVSKPVAVQRWRLPTAVAASIAAVVTAGLLVLPPRDAGQTATAPVQAPIVAVATPVSRQSSAQVAAAVLPATAAPVAVLPGQMSPTVSPDLALRSVSSEYLMAHRHYSAGLAMRGVVSHVRTAGYDGQ